MSSAGLAETVSRQLLHGRLLWRGSPLWSTITLVLTLLTAGIRTLLMIVIGQFVGALPVAIGQHDFDPAWRWFIMLAILLLAGPLIQAATGLAVARCSAAYLTHVFGLVAETGLHPRGIEHLDSPGYAARLKAMVEATREWSFVFGVNSTWQVLGPRLAGAGAIMILLPWRWWVPFVVAASFLLLSKVFSGWISTAFDTLLVEAGDERRRASYLRGLMTRTDSAKEVRLFGLSDWLADSYRSTWFAAMTNLWVKRRRGMWPIMLACLLMACVVGGALGLLALDVVAGTVALAGAVTMAQAVMRLENFGILGDQATALARNTAAMKALVGLRREVGLPDIDLLRPPATPAPPTATDTRTKPAAAADVRLDDVTFTYPSRDEPAVHRLSLEIPAGQSIAIVGVNGAGKSTLIKLLCGLYAPEHGTVRVGGDDPATEEVARRRVAVIFQDFVRYHLSLRDNVGLGSLGRGELGPSGNADDHQVLDQQVLDQALANAGATKLLERLEHGWDTILSAEYDGGTDLSGGQWQRVALARALAAVSGGAGVLVLDEPTAALDVRAEAALFDRFLEVTYGVTTILVSHRLSSVRHVDRIVVLADPAEGGDGIIEDGSHQELMQRGGHYAEMFTLQARRFSQQSAADDEGPVET